VVFVEGAQSGPWTDTSLRAILVVVVGQFARDLPTVQAEAEVSRAIRFVDVTSAFTQPKANVQQNVQHWFLQVQ
jgi:hypothetical protein